MAQLGRPSFSCASATACLPCYPTSSFSRGPFTSHPRRHCHHPLCLATLSCTPLSIAASLDFIPAPQRESIVKRQRRLPAKVVSDRHRVCLGYIFRRLVASPQRGKIYCVLQRNVCKVVTGPAACGSRPIIVLLRLNKNTMSRSVKIFFTV